MPFDIILRYYVRQKVRAQKEAGGGKRGRLLGRVGCF